MTAPVVVAAVLVTAVLCGIAAFAVLMRQAGNHMAHVAVLHRRIRDAERERAAMAREARRAVAGRRRLEALLAEYCGTWDDPEACWTLEAEEVTFGDIAERLGSKEEGR